MEVRRYLQSRQLVGCERRGVGATRAKHSGLVAIKAYFAFAEGDDIAKIFFAVGMDMHCIPQGQVKRGRNTSVAIRRRICSIHERRECAPRFTILGTFEIRQAMRTVESG